VHINQQRQIDNNAAKRGRGINKKRHLHTVETVYLTNEANRGKGGQLSFDETEIINEIRHTFSQKWRTTRHEDWVRICDSVFAAEGSQLNFTSADVGQAIDRIGDHQKFDAHGVCIQAIKMIHIAHPDKLMSLLRRCAADTAQINALKVSGKAFGKQTKRTSAKNMRAILPLPSVLQVLDGLVARQLDTEISQAIQQAPENLIGARRGTQCLDILHPLQLISEKCNDTGAQFTVGQMDIAAYYDNLPFIKLHRWLTQNISNATLAAKALRLQAFPQITIATSTTTTQFKHRTCGGITGSRVAGQLGRIPVETALRDNTHNHPHHGLTFDATRVQQFSWVDNLVAVGTDLDDTTHLLDDLATVLRNEWELTIKKDSRQLLTNTNGTLTNTQLENDWKVHDHMDLLGHRLSHNASINACWTETRAKLWAAFYANPGNKRWQHLPSHRKVVLLDRFCLPILRHRCSRWPPQKTIADKIDAIQRKMVTMMMHVPPLPTETPERYVQRKSNMAATVIRHFSMKWSQRWYESAVNWDDHCGRHTRNLTTKLKQWRCDSYLRSLRQPFVPQRPRTDRGCTIFAGRLGTRPRQGRPPTRWHEGVQLAKYMLKLENKH
jgi:hypothetical protein